MCVVLVADDDDAVRNLVCAMLGSAGHLCFSAANGLEAVALFRSNPDKIDVVLTDITMPVMDGTQAAVRIRETKPAVPVIFMSGYSSTPLPADAHVVQKPFTREVLLDALKQVVP